MRPRDPPVSWELDGNIAVLTITSPPANAVDETVAAALLHSLVEIEATAAKVLVVRSGIPGCFAEGADINRIVSIGRVGLIALLTAFREAVESLGSLPLASIAAVEGSALGGGLELALACTIRVASRSSRLGLPEVKLGLLPGGGGTQRLPRLVGRASALDLLITGRAVGGEEALGMRLVDRLTENGAAFREALAMAGRLALLSRPALASITRCVDVAQSLPFPDGMAVEAEEIMELFCAVDVADDAASFVEKHSPKPA
jgi:enoyl-CoA hydratase/carnithine racemase